jgi:hypothetical protein
MAPCGHASACLENALTLGSGVTVERGRGGARADGLLHFLLRNMFYPAGSWLIVVQTRHAEWRGSSLHRRRAYGVAMHFSLPGLMSLLALINTASSALWRTSFAIAALGGAIVLIAVRGAAPRRAGSA